MQNRHMCYGHALLRGSVRWCTLCFPHHCNVPHLIHLNRTIRFGFVLFIDTWSQEGHSVIMHDHTFSKLANHQIRHQATHKVGCQSGDCAWSLQSSSGVYVGIYGLRTGGNMFSFEQPPQCYPNPIAFSIPILLLARNCSP